MRKIVLVALLNALLSAAVAGAAVPAFPIKHSANKRYLVDQNGVPFPILARTAWFITSLSTADYRTFIDDTAARGYTAIEFHVINHDPRGNNPPFNGNGDRPFLNRLDGAAWTGALTYGTITNEAPNFTTPNEAYWTHVDGVLAYAESKGLLVFFFPAYVGYAGGNQGWMQEMVANGAAKMQSYGAWIATRYKNQKNLVWMMGGDMGTVPNTFNSAQTTVESALLNGLKSVAGQQSTQFSAEWNSESIATDQTSFGSAMTLNGAYSWTGDVNTQGRRAYARSSVIPAFLQEGPFDEEGPVPDGNGVNPSATQPVRRFQWWGWLSTIGGHITGNGYVWPFRSDNSTVNWRNHLDSPGTRDMARMNAFVKSIAWQDLVPSGLGGMKTIVVEGGSSVAAADYVAAAAALNGSLLVAYVPPAHSGSITVDLSVLSGSVRARWFDPTSANYSDAGTGPDFAPPGANSAGANDWVLVIDRGPDATKPSLRVTSPTTTSAFTNTTGVVNIAGTASDNTAVSRVTWNNNRGGEGIASGTSSWSIPGITLAPGQNQLTFTAEDISGNSTQAVLSATYLVPPFFLAQPASRSAATNDTVTFDVEAGGDEPFRFQWRKNGANIAGATNDSFTLFNITTTSAASYSVAVSNAAGARVSSNAVLKVFVPPTLTAQPAARSLTEGGSAKFKAAATGTTPLFFQWWLNGEAVGGATNASYSIARVQTNQAGFYTVTVSNFAGVRISTNALLRVNVLPRFLVQPSAQSVVVGPTNLIFFADASGTEPLRFQWRRNGSDIFGATNASYTLTNITATSGATYSVTVANVAGKAVSTNALLKVFVPPTFASQPLGRTVTEGGSASFSVTVSGTTPLFYQWRREGADFPGATNRTLTLLNISGSSAGNFDVVVSNFAGLRVSSNAVLTVIVPPRFVVQPQSQMIAMGTPATFTSEVSGTAPFKFQWRRNGSSIAGATNASFTIPVVTNTSFGSYSVFVQNLAGSVTSTNAVLEVLPPFPPSELLAAEASPVLSVVLDVDHVVITWPAGATSFTLQSSVDLIHWQAQPAPGVVDGICIAKDKLEGPARFYRLVK